MTFTCKTVEDTQKLAAHIGRVVKGGEIFEFYSDLGGGKTAFVKGLARGMGVKGVVQSPTFTISFIHPADRGLELHHFDFYRLADAGIMSAELAESLDQQGAVVAIEWGEVVHNVLPANRISVTLRTLNSEEREITIDIPQKYDYIQTALKKFKK